MSIIQIIIVGFAAIALSRILTQFRQGSLTIAWMLLWTLFWSAVAFVTLMPQTADMLAVIFGVGRGADAVIYLSLVVVFALLFRFYMHLEGMERQITRLVRELALKDLDQK